MQSNQRAEIESLIKDILVSHLDVNRETMAASNAETPLLGSGIGLDSVEAMILASEIESVFQIHFEDHELTPEMFRTIHSLANAVISKT